MKRVFSGVQPTGNLHIGNYLGALKQFVELQDDHECIYCVVDMHAITLPQDPKELRSHILDIAALYLAVGVDPSKSIIFVQSEVPAHTELSWILTCSSYMGELQRMTQFKDKSKGRENSSIPTGIFTYPVLMAADILLYDTDIVPVGNDQKQHIELARDLAIRVNNRFDKKIFQVPEGRFLKEGARIMSLDDPTSKMSKSAENEFSRISLLDTDAKIKKAIMRATTDSDAMVKFDVENKPGISNLLSIYSVFSGKSIETLEKEYEGRGYGDFKKDLVEVTIDAISPIRSRFEEIRQSEELLKVLDEGAEKANAIAERVLKRTYDAFGMGRKRK
ncbi:MAG: tryptophan--tRNA ligase [Firmicutes bacterium]|nr:tryptophan--tRNA ligase [Bacillota bacterium]MBQ3122615.1 tryptophan--tRNA ligase [Bacillota bacterium]MBQ9972859.1 tryptophan--tRNA ligase [Bacillota bacterium]